MPQNSTSRKVDVTVVEFLSHGFTIEVPADADDAQIGELAVAKFKAGEHQENYVLACDHREMEAWSEHG